MGWFEDNAPTGDRTAPTPGNRGSGEPTSSPYGAPVAQAPAAPAGDVAGEVQRLLQSVGGTATPEALAKIEPQLNKLGVQLQKSSAGEIRGRLYLPTGQAVDVVPGSGWGGAWSWTDRGASSGGAGGPSGSGLPAGYEMGTYTGGGKYPLASVMAPGLMQPWTTPFTAPNDVTQQNDPGWQFRLSEGQKAIERSAAAKGTLYSGKTMKDVMRYGQEYASGEYDKVYQRALGEYQTAYGAFSNNQANQFGRLYNLSSLGANAAGGQANANTSYADKSGDVLQSLGDVTGGAIAGRGNAWGNFTGNLGDLINAAIRARQTGGTVVG